MSVVIRTAQNVAASVGNNIEHTTNRLLPAKQRERALENLRTFSVRNPKLATFLAAQTALAGLPVLLFLAFAVATLFASLVTCIVLGIIAAFIFTFLITGIALLFLVPIVIVGSCTASVIFFWGLVGYLVLRRINGGETPVQPGTKVGDSLNMLTGGRLQDLVDRSDPDLQQERLAQNSSQDEVLHMDREDGSEGYGTHRGSPCGRRHGHTNGLSDSGEARQEGEEDGTRSAQLASRIISKRAQHPPEAHVTTYDPAAAELGDWKKEFHQEGITA